MRTFERILANRSVKFGRRTLSQMVSGSESLKKKKRAGSVNASGSRARCDDGQNGSWLSSAGLLLMLRWRHLAVM